MEIDVGTRAILKLMLLPPGILVLLLLIGWLFARRFFGRFLVLLATLSLYLLSTPAVVDLLAAPLESVPAASMAELRDSRAQAILIFLADVSRNNPELDGADTLGALSLQRMDYGLALHRQTSLPLILAGGSVKDDSTPVARLAADWLTQRTGIKPLAIEQESRDTRGNAFLSAELLQTLGIDRVLLVTHAAHMPRALLNARAAGIDAVPAPFGFEHTPAELREPGEIRDWLPQPGMLGRSYLVLHEMLGLVWYGLNHG